jgi:hypothetical protein
MRFLLTPMTDSLERACAALRERGYTVAIPSDRAAPAAVATPGPDAEPPIPLDGGLALEPLATRSRVRRARDAPTHGVAPTRVVDAVAAAVGRGLTCLFLVDERGAAAAREVLTDPPGVSAVDADGCRTFYDVPDRLSTEAGLACVRTDESPVWREEPATGVITGSEEPDTGTDRGDDRTGRDDRPTTAGQARQFVLEADGRVHAAFDDYAALACPTAEAFPYTYRRGADKRIHVQNRAGHEVGVYPSIRDMKADAYRPVADPLVPEVHLDGANLGGSWALAVDDSSAVRFER